MSESPATPSPPRRFTISSLRETPATITFVAINAVVFLAAEIAGDTTTIDTLVRFGASGRSLVWAGEPWRLLTSVFLHIGWIHFLWNSWGLFGWCTEVERLLGSARFASIYFLTGIGASAGSVIGHSVISAGASGAGFGIVGTLLLLRAREHGSLQALLKDPRAKGWLQGIAIWFVLGFFMNMDNIAHGTGLALGLAGGAAFTASRSGWRWLFVALTAVLVMLALGPIPGVHGEPSDVERARTLWQKEDWPGVLSALEKTLQREDAPTEAFEAAAVAHFMLGNWAESKAAGDRVMQVEPRNGRVLALRCGAYNSLGDFESARRACERAISFGNNDEWTRGMRFEALVALGDFTTGEADAERLVNRNATADEGLRHRAHFRWLKGNYAGAESDYRTLLERQSAAWIHANLALVLSNMGRHDEANAELEKRATVESSSYLVPYLRCMTRSSRGEYSEALSDCDEAIRRAPTNPGPRDARAWALYRSGRVEDSLSEVEATVEAGSKIGLSTRALIRAEQGQLEGALSDAAAALRGETRSAAAWLARARVAMAKKDSEEALTALRRAERDLAPSDDLSEVIRSEIRALERDR